MRSAAALIPVGCVYPPCADAAYSLSTAQMAQHDILASVPAWSMALTRIPLRFAGQRRGGPVPAVWVSVRSAAALYLAGYAVRLFVLAVIPARGAAGRIAPAVHLRKNLRILCGLGAGSHDAAVGQLHGRFRGRSLLPARSLCVPRCLSGWAASRCRPTLLQISVPSAAAQWMQLDVSVACLSGGRFVLEYPE